MPESQPSDIETPDLDQVARRQLIFGWWALLVFLSLGIVLEALHAVKLGLYLNVSNETRRLMWTLAHAHGTLLALVNLAYALALKTFRPFAARWQVVASKCFRLSTLLLPTGFFLGGVVVYGGDPGLGILLVPVGAIFLVVGVFLCALGFRPNAPRR